MSTRGHTTLSLAAVLAESAARAGDRIAIVAGDERISYAELWRQARATAGALRDRGVGAGTPVAVMIPNVPAFPRVYYAVLALGGVVVPVHPLSKAGEIEHVLTVSGARLLIADAGMASQAETAAAATGVELLTVGARTGPSLDTAAATAEPIDGYRPMHPLDPAAILFTSGTSGRAKGAVLSQLNLVEQTHVALIDSIPLRADDVMCAALPLSHVFGQSNVMNLVVRRGATMLLIGRFEAASTLAEMVRHRVTVFAGVPTMLIGLLEAARNTGSRPPLRFVISGGASLPEAVLERFAEEFGAPVHEGYGLSETSPTATINHVGQPARAGTVGRPVWGVEVGIADPGAEGGVRLLGEGSVGEVVVRGHSLFLGYHDDPAATAAAVVDGWFRTGDLGRRDADGRLSIVDRTKDVILRGGYNVYPREVEEVLARMPGVRGVAVFGVPDERYGQEVVAAVVPEGTELDEAGVIAYARAAIAAHKYPRRVVLLDALPLGPSGKVLKRELSRLYG